MKKFFSLVLALVMALSLTTVAWGASVEMDVTSNADLADKLKNTAAQEVVINLSETPTDGTHYIIDLYSHSTVNAAIKSLTINGTGTTKVSFHDLQVNASLFNKLTINKCEILHMNTKPWGHLVFGESVSGGVYTVSNCIFNGVGTTGIYFNPKHDAECVIENCTFTGDFGDEGAVVVQNRPVSATLTVSDNNTFKDLESEAVAVWFKDETLDVTSPVGVVAMVNNADEFEDAVAAADAGDTIKLMGNVTVTDVVIDKPININENGNTLTGMTAGSGVTTDASGNVTSGVFADAPANVADGYEALLTPDGTYVVVEEAANTSSASGLYAKATSKGATLQKNITLNFFKAVDNKVDKKTGEYVADGNVAYYMIDGVITKYAEVYTLADADMVIYTDEACKNVYAYLDVVNPFYVGDGVVTKNFGTACGQYSNDEDDGFDDETTYYVVFDQLCVGVEAGQPYEAQILVNDKLVAVNASDIPMNLHKAIYNRNDKNEITSIKCAVCGIAAVEAPNFLSLPENPDIVDGTQLWYWPAATAGTTTGKVESAATFDAGIALYVGMSVMAAAGSAVVIGKKKD